MPQEHRAYSSKWMPDLEIISDENWTSISTLQSILEELEHRNSNRARLLKLRITERLNTLSSHQENNTSNNESNTESINIRILTCLSCNKKIRVTFPFGGNQLKCPSCSIVMNVIEDENGHIYITEQAKSSEQSFDTRKLTTEICFQILGVQKNSSPREIKTAYRNKIKEYHPDKVSQLGSRLQEVAEEESKQINAVYEFLKNNGMA